MAFASHDDLSLPPAGGETPAGRVDTGGGAYVAGTVNTGGGDFIGRDQINITIYNVTAGIQRASEQYRHRIAGFMSEYLGRDAQPVPFGGRDETLAMLDGWLEDENAPPYALLAAPAGRGKSALLVHWVHRLQRQDAAVVFVPVSIRFETAVSNVFFSSLAARLAEVFGEQALLAPGVDWKASCESYLRRNPPQGKQILLVLDGLDEAADWQMNARFFPTPPLPGWRVLVSARYLANEDETGWLKRLGWQDGRLATAIPLPPLDQNGVMQVVETLGGVPGGLAGQMDWIDALYRLSAGDPLLVRLYLEELRAQGEKAAALSPADLHRLQPGLEGYIGLWWQEQREQWQAEGKDADEVEERLEALLYTLASALGPLSRADLLAVAPPDSRLDDGLWLERALRSLRRLVIGDGAGQGFVFSHSRIGDYFDERMKTRRDYGEWQQRFVAYGRRALERLNAAGVAPSTYILQHYGAHLERSGAPPHEFFALVCKPWLEAWQKFNHAPFGFMSDVQRAWKHAQGTPAALGFQVRGALVISSIYSAAAATPLELVAACVRQGVITSQVGWEYASQKKTLSEKIVFVNRILDCVAVSERRALQQMLLLAVWEERDSSALSEAMTLLAPHLLEELLEQALNIVRASRSAYGQADALAALAPRLPDDLLQEAVRIAAAGEDAACRRDAWVALAPYLHTPAHFLAVLQAAPALPNADWGADVLLALLPGLPVELLPQALAAAGALADEFCRLRVLGAAAGRLEGQPQAQLCAAVTERARRLEQAQQGCTLLLDVAPHLPAERRAALYLEVLERSAALPDWERQPILCRLAPCLPEGAAARFVEIVAAMDAGRQTPCLAAIAPYLDESQQACALAALQRRPVKDRMAALVALIPALPAGVVRRRALEDVLRLLPRLDSWEHEEHFQAVAACLEPDQIARLVKKGAYLEQLAGHLPAELIQLMLRSIPRQPYDWDRGQLLRALLPRLQGEQLLAAQHIYLQIDDKRHADLQAEIVRYYPAQRLAEALDLARQTLRDGGEAGVFWAALGRLEGAARREFWLDGLQIAAGADRLIDVFAAGGGFDLYRPETLPIPDELARQALDAARRRTDMEERPACFAALAPYLPAALLAEALDSIHGQIGDGAARLRALAALAPWLGEDLLSGAVQSAEEIIRREGPASERMWACFALGQRLQGELRARMAAQVKATQSMPYDEWPILAAEILSAETPAERKVERLLSVMDGAFGEADASSFLRLFEAAEPDLSAGQKQRVLAAVIEALPRLDRRWVRGPADLLFKTGRADVLVRLAPYWGETWIGAALASAREIDVINYNPDNRSDFSQGRSTRRAVLVALLPYLPGALAETTLAELAQDDLLPDERVRILGWRASQAGAEERGALLDEAWKLAEGIFEQDRRFDAMLSLLPLLAPERQSQALGQMVQLAGLAGVRDLGRLAPWLDEAHLARAAALLGERMGAVCTDQRSAVLDIVAAGAALIARSGEAAAAEAARGILDCGVWWP